MAKTLLKLPEV